MNDWMNDWTCKICGRKIGWFCRILGIFGFGWYQTDEGKVHQWCHDKPKNKDRPLNIKFA